MSKYQAGDTITHMFAVRLSGNLTNADSLPTASLYEEGVSTATVVTVTLVSTGIYSVTAPAPSLSHNADVHIIVHFSVGGQGQTVVFEDQVEVAGGAAPTYPTPEEIAEEVLVHAVSDAIANLGAIDRHSLGAALLMLTNSESVASPDQINIKHPDTDITVHSYPVTKGPACPVQSIT